MSEKIGFAEVVAVVSDLFAHGCDDYTYTYDEFKEMMSEECGTTNRRLSKGVKNWLKENVYFVRDESEFVSIRDILQALLAGDVAKVLVNENRVV